MSYIGKDVIHYGCGLVLNPEQAWKSISHAARKNIKKASELNIEVKKCTEAKSELEALRSIWYHPQDPNFPTSLAANDLMYLAYHGGRLIGGMILIPVGRHLFLNNLAANKDGKLMQVQSHLLWHAVENLRDSGYEYIDVGVSYRPNLYRFFKNWATFTYPVIFNPPAQHLEIGFRPMRILSELNTADVNPPIISDFALGRPFTIVPTKELAEEILNKKGGKFIQASLPDPENDMVQLIDLTEAIPIRYGALIVGVRIDEQSLWNDHGCFDFVKTEHIMGALSHPDNGRKAVIEKRKEKSAALKAVFSREDLECGPSDNLFSALSFQGEQVKRFAKALERFRVGHRWSGDKLLLPTHQNLSAGDIEYIYAIYRGALNLCSEWTPTHVKGTLKSQQHINSPAPL